MLLLAVDDKVVVKVCVAVGNVSDEVMLMENVAVGVGSEIDSVNEEVNVEDTENVADGVGSESVSDNEGVNVEDTENVADGVGSESVSDNEGVNVEDNVSDGDFFAVNDREIVPVTHGLRPPNGSHWSAC
ncbi:hypothetical protein DIPPA_14333 [Diplonema papillatum]|nr:hypothetical protein DIPPA_14333 [Diplonema papillatum]